MTPDEMRKAREAIARATGALGAVAATFPSTADSFQGIEEGLRLAATALREAADRQKAMEAQVARLREAAEKVCSEFYQHHPLIVSLRAALSAAPQQGG